MTGVINSSIEEMIITEYGYDAWNKVRSHSDIQIEHFISTEVYEDDITYKLAESASEVLDIPLYAIMASFGEWWILHSSRNSYGTMLASGGKDLREFLLNLPNFHARIMILYPDINPPEFRISHVNDESITIHFHTLRMGLHTFLHGLLSGLGKVFHANIKVEIIATKAAGCDHDVFRVNWI